MPKVSNVSETPAYFSLSLSGKHLSYGKSELGNTFCRFTLFGTKRKKSTKTACGSVLPFHSWNISLCPDKERVILVFSTLQYQKLYHKSNNSLLHSLGNSFFQSI